jgi:hypothetical protein
MGQSVSRAQGQRSQIPLPLRQDRGGGGGEAHEGHGRQGQWADLRCRQGDGRRVPESVACRLRKKHGAVLDIRPPRGDRTTAHQAVPGACGVWGSRSSPRLTCAGYTARSSIRVCSRRTVRKIHSTLHKALSQAVYDGMVPRNAADVKAPRPTPEEMRPLSEDEARTFLKAVSQSSGRPGRETPSRPIARSS